MGESPPLSFYIKYSERTRKGALFTYQKFWQEDEKMFNPFRMFCFAPDGVPDGAPAADAENEQEQHDDQQPETTEQTGDAAAKAAQTAAPAGKEQPVPKDEPKKDDNKTDDLAARVVTANARAMQAELRTAAALAGVPKERIPYVLRMCDTEGIDLDAADAQDKLDAAVAKVLEAVPELCGGAGTGSTGNFARRNGNAEDALDAKIRENIMGAY